MARTTDKRWKGQVIDWLEIADMDSLDYELKPLNQQQVAILLMLLEYQRWDTRWINLDISKDELQTFIGEIEYRLMLNEGFAMTTEELENAIANGGYKMFNWLAGQVVSGKKTGFSVGTDGTVTVGSGDGVTLPVDDPATLQNEKDMARAGGIIKVEKGVQSFLFYLHQLFGADSTEDYTPDEAKFLVAARYKVDAALLSDAIDNYWASRALGNVQYVSYVAKDMQNQMWKNGATRATAIAFISQDVVWAVEILKIAIDCVASLLEEQFSDWYELGILLPSTLYLDYQAVPIAPATGFVDWSLGDISINSPKAYHRMQYKLTGHREDPDGDIQDAFWYVEYATGNRYFSGQLSMQQGLGWTYPLASSVPYRSDHEYNFTVDTTSAGTLVARWHREGAMNPASTGTGITIEVKDLGDYSI